MLGEIRKALLLLLFMLPLGAWADAGMVTLLKGEAWLKDARGAQTALVPFGKLRQGDVVELAPATRLQILYTASGRQETWQGKARLEVGGTGSVTLEASVPPSVKTLPTAALNRLAQAPVVLTDIRNRTGMVMVRSGAMIDRIREIETVYSQMRADTPREDITPELYLVSALYDLRLFRDLEEIVADIVSRQPENAEARAILDNIKKAMGREEGGQ